MMETSINLARRPANRLPAIVIGTALAAALLVAAAPPEAAAQGFFDRLTDTLGGGGGGGDAAETTYLDRMRSEGTGGGSCGGDGQTALLNAYVEQGLGVVRDQALHDYLGGILKKLLAQSTMPDCRVTVFVTPHDAAQAVALADGGILIAMGFLRNLKSEDEVAALLAHEVSHILRKHHDSDSFLETQSGFLKGLDTANAAGSMLVGFVDPNLQSGLDAASSVGGAFYQISESMIAPAWTRDQEDEADLLGTDLLVAAGYNPRAMAAIMDVIAVQEANAAEIEAEREKLHQASMQQTLVDSATKTDFSNPFSIVGTAAKITTGLVSGATEESHRPAAERKEAVNEYIRKFHGEHRRRKFAAEPWAQVTEGDESGNTFTHYQLASNARRAVFGGGDLGEALSLARSSVGGRYFSHPYPRLAHSEVRLKQGDRQKAMENLEIVIKENSFSPWYIYRNYAELQLANGDRKGAAATVDSADAIYGRPVGIAPYAIKIYRQLGDEDRVYHYLNRCDASGQRQHMQICLTAAGIDHKEYMANAIRHGGSRGR